MLTHNPKSVGPTYINIVWMILGQLTKLSFLRYGLPISETEACFQSFLRYGLPISEIEACFQVMGLLTQWQFS